ncbi:hypothetical protein BLNAU_6868 [Blattamonas nauphoetae]|uniref:PB1 domain-containing protein n=1 Tax=Blattamonas nauphoetae TaxID=2049346 RepID=A0ABQ9Y3C0_9EUKA|nr:hypothetical protein BLNAU_6868 [Blattamonas nauphoetae]
MSNPQQFIVKITFTQSGDTRRVQFVAPPSFDDLKTRCHVLFGVSPHESVALTYNDCEDDTITIANDADVGLAFLSRPQNECLRIVFSVRPKPTLPNAPFHTHPFQHTNFHRDFRYQHVPPVELHQSPFDQPRGRFRRGEKKKPFWTDRKWKFDDSVLKDQINSMVSDIQAFFAPTPKEHTQQPPQPATVRIHDDCALLNFFIKI